MSSTGTSESKVGSQSTTSLQTGTTSASMGARYVYKALSLEASLQTSLWSNGPADVITQGNFLSRFSALLNF